MTHFSAFTHI